MPRKVESKPTKIETKAATELQAPIKSESKAKTQHIFKSAKKLAESGVKIDDGNSLSYFHPKDYFSEESFAMNDETGESELTDGSISNPFVITNAVQMKGKFGLMLRLTVCEKDEEKSFVGLSLENKEGFIEERVKILNHFKTNTYPLGPVCFVAVPSNYGNQFMTIQDFDDDIPF